VNARRGDLVELAAVVAVWLWTAVPFFGLEGYPTSVDQTLYSGPNHVVNMNAWRHLRLGFWDAGIFGGTPHLANEQAGALYPLKLLVLPFGAARGMGLLVAMHLLIFALGMWWLARRTLRLAAPAGFVAAAVAVMGGVAMVKSLQFEQLLVFALAPLLMIALDAVLSHERPWLAMAATALLIAMTAFAGHPQIVYVLVLLEVGWLVIRAADHRAWGRAGLAVAAVALGALVAAVQLVPTADLASRTEALATHRTNEQLSNPSYVLDPALIPVALLGDPTSTRPVALAGTSEAASYIGAAAFALAAIGLAAGVLSRRRRWTGLGLGVLSLIGVLLALGPRFFLYNVLLDIVPGFGLARVPARWLVVWGVAMALLAAMGTDALVRRLVDRRTALVAVSVVGVLAVITIAGPAGIPPLTSVIVWVLAAGIVAIAPAVREAPGRWAMVGLLLPALAVGAELGAPTSRSEARLLRVPTAFESYASNATNYLQGKSGKVLTLTFDKFDEPAYLVGAMRPNANVIVGVPSLDGYDGGLQVTRRWAAMADTFSTKPFDRDLPLRNQIDLPVDAAHLARLGVRWMLIETAVLYPEQQVPGWIGPLTKDGTVELYENPEYRGEASLWNCTLQAADAAAAANASATPPASSAAVVEPDGPVLQSDDCSVTPATIARPHAGRVVVDVDASSESLLTVAEQFDAGWQVTLDGHVSATHPADGFLLATALGPGHHRVVFSYQPPKWPLAVTLSLLGLAGVVALVVIEIVVRRRPRRDEFGTEDVIPLDEPVAIG
jgi:MFS family permease